MKTNETMDPLTRIQEEIKEVVRREEEYHRQLTTTASPEPLIDLDDQNGNKTNTSIDSTLESNDNSLTINSVQTTTTTVTATETETETTTQVNNINNNTTEIATENLLAIHDDNHSNTPSLSSSVNSKESLDGHHSDDSGISASSSPVNGKSNDSKVMIPNANSKEHRYIGPNCYNMTPEPPQQKLMTRTVSTPHLAVTKPKFPLTPAHKGVMERFIASRGKLQLNVNNSNSSNMIMLNGKSAAALLNVNSPTPIAVTHTPNSPTTLAINSVVDFNARNPTVLAMPATTTLSPAVIERDAEGRPIRPGYIPVELKIQRELKDLKSRESELKKIRKLRQSTSDLDSIDNENIETDEDDEEHCYGPGQLRSAKSINELCDPIHANNSISDRATPSPLNFARMRPAMSLAQLCDLTPEEAPSSHRLIAQWESLIQQNA